MKNLFNKVKTYFTRNRFTELEEKIDSLENRLFEKKKEPSSMYEPIMFGSSFYGLNWEPETLEKEIDILQKKMDALCRHFKVEVSHKEEDKWVVKKTK